MDIIINTISQGNIDISNENVGRCEPTLIHYFPRYQTIMISQKVMILNLSHGWLLLPRTLKRNTYVSKPNILMTKFNHCSM